MKIVGIFGDENGLFSVYSYPYPTHAFICFTLRLNIDMLQPNSNLLQKQEMKI